MHDKHILKRSQCPKIEMKWKLREKMKSRPRLLLIWTTTAIITAKIRHICIIYYLAFVLIG